MLYEYWLGRFTNHHQHRRRHHFYATEWVSERASEWTSGSLNSAWTFCSMKQTTHTKLIVSHHHHHINKKPNIYYIIYYRRLPSIINFPFIYYHRETGKFVFSKLKTSHSFVLFSFFLVALTFRTGLKFINIQLVSKFLNCAQFSYNSTYDWFNSNVLFSPMMMSCRGIKLKFCFVK